MTATADDVDFGKMAAAWVVQVREHRAAQRVYGKVSAAVIDTPDGSEIHLTEETTFKAAKGQPCPLTQAINWLKARDADRKANDTTGGGRVEYDQKGGVVTWAKVVETTIKSTANAGRPLDLPRKIK